MDEKIKDSQQNKQPVDDQHNHQQDDRADEMQKIFAEKIGELSQPQDFKNYFKLQREIIREYLGSWGFVEAIIEPDPMLQYKMLLESFSKKAELDDEQNKIDKKKKETIDKFTAEVLDNFNKKDFAKSSQQLFYVLLGNVLEHVGKADFDMKKFNIEKDLYPDLKPPLSIAFFLFQNLTFGPISKKINELSQEYLKKYCALLLGLWRSVFEFMMYEKRVAANKTQNTDDKTQDVKDTNNE